ncbi:matrin 3-like 1.2 [Antennarius striatus]|uniref:matrin 3-like 1.2 n=1 Tax=Antennarius striatus TaxID=241820 RepID=UPI0035B3536F
MSQKPVGDGGQKHFAAGRGLLAAAETLNFSINEQRSGQQVGGLGVGGGGMESQDSQMPQRGGHIGSTMKLFASLGLSPSDLDALAEIPEEDISVETLPQILMQLKNRKGDAGERRAASSMSSDAAYRGGRDNWGDMHGGRMGGPSLGQSSSRPQSSADFGFSSLQDAAPSRGFGFSFGGGGGGGSRERLYSDLSRRGSDSGLGGMGAPSSEPAFMQRRMGSPSNGKIRDFLGAMPTMLPYVCSLCDFDVHSTVEWKQHTYGLQHAEKRRMLLEMYPDWDPGMSSSRSGGRLDGPNLSAGLLGPAPMSSAGAGGMSSSWGGGGGSGLSGQNQLRSRVVVVKYDRKPLSNKTLLDFTKPFGRLRENLILKNKAFLEMSSHEEAQDMVNYYNQHPATLYNKPIAFYLSRTLLVIEKEDRVTERPLDRPIREVKGHGSQVVFFSKLPKETEKKKELLTIAGRFGTVEKHVFLNDQAFIQLGTPEDAEMLVKYYTVNPLTLRGRPVHLNICTKYKTLTVNRRRGASAGDNRPPRSREASASSPGSGSKTSSRTTPSRTTPSRASSTSRSKEGAKEGGDQEDKPSADGEQEEEVSGVMEADDQAEEQVADGDAEGAEPEDSKEETKESEDVQQEVPDGDEVTDVPGDGGGAENDTKKGVEPGGQTEAETEKEEVKEEAATTDPVEGEGGAEEADPDFLENMEDFVTLDELAEDEDEDARSDIIDDSRKAGMRVVNVIGFKRGYNLLSELLALAKPFGKVVKHLVLDLRPEAYLQFETESEARAMAKFYNSNVTASVCGRPVRISHSVSYPTIRCGSSKVVYVGQIPTAKYSDEAVLKLAEPFGPVRKYFTNMIKRECFLEMVRAEDAEKMAEHCKANPLKLNGKRLTVYVSRKYRQLKHGHRCPPPSKRENSPRSSKNTGEPPAKRPREEREEEGRVGEEEKEEDERVKEEEKEEEEGKMEEEKGKQEEEENLNEEEEKLEEEKQNGEEEEEPTQNVDAPEKREEPEETPDAPETTSCQEEAKQEEEMETNQIAQMESPPPAENKSGVASLPLPPHDPDKPIGAEHVKAGFYCRICFLFYSNEETAKKTHCSSRAHYDKLQKHLEKEQNKSAKKKGKKTTA